MLAYDLVRTVLRDDRFVMPKGIPLSAQGITSGELWDISLKGLLSLDGGRAPSATAAGVKGVHPQGRRTATQDVRRHHLRTRRPPAGSGRCDVVSDIARQYPIPIICAMLGTPPDDWHLFSDWADDVFKIFDWYVVDDEPDILRAWHALEAYLDGMVTRRRDALTDDLLSDMIRAQVDGDRLAHDELLTLAATLLMAGTDATRNELATAVQVFCDHPDQWALLAGRPELAPKAVEEAMRYSPVIFTTMRTAVEDVELRSFTIRAGTLVIANTAAANRDLAIYDDPDRFDITRAGAPALLTFGGGIHYCLGAHLARAELAEALTTMARRMPNIRAAGSVPWKSITGISGPVLLPIEFDCAATRRQVQALTAQLFTLATTKAGPAEPPITKRARLREATNRPTRAS